MKFGTWRRIAQWLRRRSLYGGLSMTCVRSIIDRWPLCGYNVRDGSATRPTQPSIPMGLANEYLHGLREWRPLKRQTR